MKMLTKYAKTFKIEAVKKVMSRNPGTSINAVARSLGVKITTLHGRVKGMDSKVLREDPPTSGGSVQKNPYNWSDSERFEAILETARLPQEEIGEYCRKKGIFPHHIDQWKPEFIKPRAHFDGSAQIKGLKKEVGRLNSELDRKEKALAETAALLVLKKKAKEGWGDNEAGYFPK